MKVSGNMLLSILKTYKLKIWPVKRVSPAILSDDEAIDILLMKSYLEAAIARNQERMDEFIVRIRDRIKVLQEQRKNEG